MTCPNDLCTLAQGGYAFAYSDGSSGGTGTSTAALASSGALCVCGTAAKVPDTTSYSTFYGGGLGINLNQPVVDGVGGTAAVATLSSTGVTYKLNQVPVNGRIVIGDSTDTGDYCYNIPASKASDTVPWTSFVNQCWAASGTALTAAPTGATSIRFQVYTDTSSTHPIDFCLESLSL